LITTKKIYATFLLGIQIIPLVLFFSVQLNRLFIQFEMKEKLEAQSLQRIVLDEHSINWVEQGAELVMNGQLFDVHSINRLSNGKVEIFGLTDTKEDQLNTQVELLTKHKNGLQSMLAKLIVVQSIGIVNHPTEAFFSIKKLPKKYAALHCKCIKFSIDIITPPPQLV